MSTRLRSTAGLPRIAGVQMASGPNVEGNLNEAERLIAMAAEQGASLVALPENFALMGMSEHDKVVVREEDGAGPIQAFLAASAKRHNIWVAGGSVPLVSSVAGKVRSACLVYDGSGRRVARYDKIHLFGFEMGEESYREERTIEPGSELVTMIRLPWATEDAPLPIALLMSGRLMTRY